MKLWKLFFLFFLTGNASAFFTNDALEIQQKTISISVREELAQVEIVTEIANQTESEIDFQILHPLGEGMEVEDFFVDMEGKAYSVVEGKERLGYLFSQAKERDEAKLLQWGSDKYPKLFRSENLAIEAHQKVRTKNVFNLPVRTHDDFSFLAISQSDIFANTEIIFETEESVEYFYHTLGGSSLTDLSDGVTFLWTGEPSGTFQFFWTDVADGALSTSFLGMEYQAKFVPPISKDIQEVTILVDKSGSLTGLPWQRTKNWIEFLLETLNEEVNVRIGFFSEGIEWHEEVFQPNIYELKKDFFGFLSGIAPVGETDIDQALLDVQDGWTVDPAHRVVFLITDETELSDVFLDNEISETYVTFQFTEDLENDLALFSKLSGGFPLKLFRSSPHLIEKNEFLEKFKNLNTNIIQNEEWKMSEGVPKIFPSQMRQEPFFFIGRISEPSGSKNASPAYFVPRTWGSLRIAEILGKFLPSPPGRGIEGEGSFKNPHPQSFSQREKEEMIDALLAIGRTFGISTKFFDDKTTRDELEENLKNATRKNLLTEILKLKTPSNSPYQEENNNGIKFLKGVPIYEIENRWQQFNFPDLVRSETHIKMAPFSEAQKELFLQFPEFTADGFGVGKEVDFCTEFRCISVLTDEREEPWPSDRAFFKDYDANHWAHGYIVRAVQEGLLEPAQNGKLHPNRAIDRGEFSRMVVEVFGLENSSRPFKETPSSSPLTGGEVFFLDVHDPAYFDAVQILVEQGIVKGYPDNTFRPLQSLTRAEGVKILLAVAGFQPGLEEENPPQSPFNKGEAEISSSPVKGRLGGVSFKDTTGWEKPWVTEAVRRGMVKGYGDGTFRPHNKLTRAEALKLVFEMRR